MQSILGGMQVANALTIDMSKARVLDNILRYWMGSVSYMSVKVAIQFSPRSGGGGKRKSYRRISKFDSKRGRCGSRGRGCRRYVEAAASTTLALISTTQVMAGSMDWTAPTSGGISPENTLTSPGAMGACMFSTSARVISTPKTSRRFSKVVMMIGRS